MILNSNFQMGLIKENLLSKNSKIIIYSTYVVIFILAGAIFLNTTYQISKKNVEKRDQRFYLICASLMHIIASVTLIFTIVQISISHQYSNLIFYIIPYGSFILSIGFLSILSFKFFELYFNKKNYLTLLYGILFAIFSISILLLAFYLVDGLATHPLIIKPVPPRELIAGKYLVNIAFQNNIAKFYDILFFASFILAWILTVIMLKQYITRIGKYRFLVLVSIPLLFHLVRYEPILNLDQNILESGTNIIPSSLGQAFFLTLMNSDIQIGGIFFGLSFLIIALKLTNNQLRKIMIITVVGITLLFGSRDLHSIFVSSIPPGGVVTISFMVLGSYMILTSILTFLKLASRDKELYANLTSRIESDSVLMKNLVSSERKIQTIKLAKPIIDEYSTQWQKKHLDEELSPEEVKDIIGDIITELKAKKSKKSI
jgi:hypothetical protein